MVEEQSNLIASLKARQINWVKQSAYGMIGYTWCPKCGYAMRVIPFKAKDTGHAAWVCGRSTCRYIIIFREGKLVSDQI